MNSIKGGHFVSISGVYKQHPAPRLETECQTGARLHRVDLTESGVVSIVLCLSLG